MRYRAPIGPSLGISNQIIAQRRTEALMPVNGTSRAEPPMREFVL
jgi:hypothetical protein